MTTQRICLWSCPRNVSTALMYAFAQHPQVSVVDEPFYAHYLSTHSVVHPMHEQVIASQNTVLDLVIDKVVLKQDSTPSIFIKNMAHHLNDVHAPFLDQLEHVFLIREPEQMLTSLIKNIPQPTILDTGYEKQFDLFMRLKEAGKPFCILDSERLLNNPEQQLKQLCAHLKLPFSRKMLSWNAGPRPEDGVWAEHWYSNVHKSTGFKAFERKSDKVPADLLPLLEKCNYYYEQLKAEALV